MTIEITFKTPDALEDAVDREIPYTGEEENEDAREALRHFLRRYIKFGECVRVEFDTEAGTARVLSTRN